ncbi:MAG: hypothetical protein QNJ91_09695 [Gammaproteobacteria bacterium]|nr:hypothetical protein [Gammaproteobacteria bacterium]
MPAVSRIDFTAVVPLAAVQRHMRNATIAAVRRSPPQPLSESQGDVKVTVTPTVDAAGLDVDGLRNGSLRVTLPVRFRVDASITGIAQHLVNKVGCRRLTFRVSAVLAPRISQAGSLDYVVGSVDNDNKGYPCRIESNALADVGKGIGETFGSGFGILRKPDYSKAVREDISARIQRGLRDTARRMLSARLGDIATLLPDANAVGRLLQRPAMFGRAISLGIDAPRLRVTGVSTVGCDAATIGRAFAFGVDAPRPRGTGVPAVACDYRVSGTLDGRPRLVFGDTWEVRGDSADIPAAVAPGFRLPARLMFPTDSALLPDASPQVVSGCVGGFRLRRVPARADLAVLQRCEASDLGNVIWLSGADSPPAGRVHTFERSMANVLQDVVDWLADPALWAGVDGAAALHREVAAMHRRLLAFQQDTRLPVDDRGAIHFSALSIDLRRVWVTDEAILADVVLNGNARLDMRVAL